MTVFRRQIWWEEADRLYGNLTSPLGCQAAVIARVCRVPFDATSQRIVRLHLLFRRHSRHAYLTQKLAKSAHRSEGHKCSIDNLPQSISHTQASLDWTLLLAQRKRHVSSSASGTHFALDDMIVSFFFLLSILFNIMGARRAAAAAPSGTLALEVPPWTFGVTLASALCNTNLHGNTKSPTHSPWSSALMGAPHVIARGCSG